MAAVSKPGGRARWASYRTTVGACLVLAGTALARAGVAVTVTREAAMQHQHPAPTVRAVPSQAAAATVNLPATADAWRRPEAPRRIEPAAIFEYMDGAGELYLAYRFDHLDVVEYASPADGEILVELYWMRTSEDAYGLLSGDWGGEPVVLKEAVPPGGPRALYGAGLLRIWSGDLYARVMATRESEASRAAVLAIGRVIAAGRTDPPPPRLVTHLPQTAAALTLRPDSVCFLRSHLVLNSVYFVSQKDILNLGPNAEAVTARYGKARLLLVRYPNAGAARAALERFRTVYLPEAGTGEGGAARIEDGWTGFRLSGRSLAVVFEAADREAATSLIATGVQTLETLEASHE
jgi:hypothetical protein